MISHPHALHDPTGPSQETRRQGVLGQKARLGDSIRGREGAGTQSISKKSMSTTDYPRK